jgi:hypothetical protein
MSRMRSAEDLEDEISKETAWRKQELTTARKLVQESTELTQEAHLRGGVLLLYAHWEGWIKSVSQLYIRYVNAQAHPYNELSSAFLGNALKTRIASVDNANAPRLHNDFAAFLQSGLGQGARLSEELVRTESNLSSKVLADILLRLGMLARSEYVMRANMIDEELVNRRNRIAHGRYLSLSPEDFLRLHQSVLVLLELFTDDIRASVTEKKYLLSPAS